MCTKIRILRRESNKIGFTLDGVSFKNIIVREQTPVDDFYTEKTVCKDDNKECIAFVDPVRMLFNQQRLVKELGHNQAQKWIDAMFNSKQDPLKELRSKLKDSDIKALIKSRHIQQPCDVVAYANQCVVDSAFLESEVAKLVAERKAEEARLKAQQTTTVEQPKTE